MVYDKAIEEIKDIFRKCNCVMNSKNEQEDTERMNKDLSDFLKRFEEGLLESNAEELRSQELEAESIEPSFDRNDLD